MKKLLYFIFGVVAIIVIAAISFILLFDPNAFRDDISAEVERVTGREFVIEGEIELSYFPWLAIDVGKTRLGNAPGFGSEAFATFERARLSVRLLPMLLRREVSVGTASLDGLALKLAVAPNGTTNWEDLIRANDAAAEEAETAGRDASELDIAGIDITNAAIDYYDRQLDEGYRLTNLSLSTGAVASGEPVRLDGGFDFELLPDGLAGDFKIDTVMLLDARANTVAFDRVDITVLGIDISAEVPAFSYDGDLEPVAMLQVDAFSMKSLMQRLDIDPPETVDPDALGKIIVDATAKVTAPAIRLDPLELVIDDTTFSGDLSLARDASGTITIDLKGDAIDLNRYMAPVPEADEAAAEEVPLEIPVDLVRAFNLRGGITLREVLLAGMTFENIELGINSSNGRLRMHPIKAEFFDGTYSGDVRIDASGNVPALSVDEKVSGVNLGALAKAVFDQDNITGTINGAFRLQGRGEDLAAMQRKLNGSMEFELLDGYYEGTDLWYELRRARALFKKEEPPELELPARTRFSNVRLTGPVTDGVFRNDDLLAQLPFLQLTGKGTVDLPTTEIDYQLTARVLQQPEFVEGATEEELEEFTEAVIPLRITGTAAAPSIKPDVEKMLRKEVEKKIKEKLLGDLFGGDKEAPAEDLAPGEEAPEEEKSDEDRIKDALKDLLKRDD